MDNQNQNERFSHRKRRAEHKKTLVAQRSVEASKRGFNIADLALILVILSLIAFFSFLVKALAPVIQSIFSQRYEMVAFTVSLPIQDLAEEDFPQKGDSMRLLDASEEGECVVTEVVRSEDGQTLLVTLKKANVRYREGIGYEIDDVRIAVGASVDLFFGKKHAMSAEIVSLSELESAETTSTAE